MFTVSYDAPLMHHGVKGMKWGVRRYQNRDGSLTSAGRAHYGKSGSGSGRSMGGGRASGSRKGGKKPLTAAQKAERKRKLIKGAKIAAAALGTAAVVGGTAYAVNRYRQGQRAKLLENPFPRSKYDPSVRGLHINTSSMRDDSRAGRSINGFRVQERPGASAGREFGVGPGFKTGSNKGSYNPTTGEYKGVYDATIPRHTNSPKGSYTSPFARSNPDTSRGMHINTSSMRDDTRAGRTVNGYRVQERPGSSAGREHSAVAGGFKTGSNRGSYNPATGEFKGVYDSRIPTHTNSPKGSYETPWDIRTRNILDSNARAAKRRKAEARAEGWEPIPMYKPKKSGASQNAWNGVAREVRGSSAGKERSAVAGGFKTGSNRGSYNPTTGEYKGVYDSRIPKHTNSPKGSFTTYSAKASEANKAAARAARADGVATYRPGVNRSSSARSVGSPYSRNGYSAGASAALARAASRPDDAVMYKPRSSSGDRVQAANAHAQASTSSARDFLRARTAYQERLGLTGPGHYNTGKRRRK